MLVPALAVALGAAARLPQASQESPAGVAQAENSQHRKKNSHADDFVVLATVFTERGFALAGAEIRVRRASEKKYRWQAVSDWRGEFAVRVPRGSEYEMSLRAKGYAEQMQRLHATAGNRADLVFHMAPVQGGKPQ